MVGHLTKKSANVMKLKNKARKPKKKLTFE
jgi:hypothetical protein